MGDRTATAACHLMLIVAHGHIVGELRAPVVATEHAADVPHGTSLKR
jgi:hypothetical protein